MQTSPDQVLVGFYLYRRLPDRKSTRLNSSHLVKSYAVFCLKKNITELRLSRASNTEFVYRADDAKARHVRPHQKCAHSLHICSAALYGSTGETTDHSRAMTV